MGGQETEMKKNWKIYAEEVLNGIILLTLASLAGSVFDFAGMVNDGADIMRGFMSGDFDMDNFMPDGWDVAQWLALIAEIVGYAMYFSGLKKFATIQQPGDAESVIKVRSGAIWMLVGVIVGHIPAIGKFFKLIFVIIGFIDMLGGYKALKRSQTFPATKGAGTLHSALVLQLIGVLIGILPFMGFIEALCDIIVFFMILDGWSAIKNINLAYQARKDISLGTVTDEDRKRYAAQVAGSSMYDLKVYAYDKRGVYEPALVALALEEIREREAGRRKRLTDDEIQRQEEERQRMLGEYSSVLAQKSDEELKELIRDEKMYEVSFIGAVREELQARVLGKRRQKTAEEIQWEQLRQEEEQRLQEEKRQEEEQRRVEEEKEEEERLRKECQEELHNKNEKASKIWLVVILLGAVFIVASMLYSLIK